MPLSDIRLRERQREAYRRALYERNELIAECHRVRTDVTQALDLHYQCSVEWDDLPVSSKQDLFLRRQMAGVGGKHRLQDPSPKEVELMDPAVEESLLESIESMRRGLIPRLQSLISAAMHVYVESLSDPELQQRHAVMRHAIDLRNVLQDQRNDITRLGVAPKRRTRAMTSSAILPTKEQETASIACSRREQTDLPAVMMSHSLRAGRCVGPRRETTVQRRNPETMRRRPGSRPSRRMLVAVRRVLPRKRDVSRERRRPPTTSCAVC